MPESLPGKTSGWWPSVLLSLTLLLILGPTWWGCTSPSRDQVTEARVAWVTDGDTVVLEGGQKVRLLGIDAPELEKEGQPADFLAHQAKRVLADLAQGQRVRLEYDELRYDRYGRVLAHLILPDGTNLSREMVRQGLARVYTIPPNVRYREELLSAQREAIQAKRAIWMEALKQDEPYYLANRHSHILHRPSCPLGQKTAPANRLRFDSKTEALLQGYSPCRSCQP